jgi:hypothetical protein
MLVLQEKEFLKMFKMPVIEVPTNLPNIRVDLPIQAFAVSLVEVVPPFGTRKKLIDFVAFVDCKRQMAICTG